MGEMDQVRAAYSAMADRYIRLFADGSGMHEDDLALIARHLSVRPGVVLDAGCGPGHLTDHLRSLGVAAIGVDLVPEFVGHARSVVPDRPFCLGSMCALPVADRSVVGVLAWYSLIHVLPEDLDDVLVELRRVLVDGGALVIGFFEPAAGSASIEAFDHQVAPAYYWSGDEIARRLHSAGFTEVERTGRPGVDEAGRRPHGAIAAVAGGAVASGSVA